MALSIGRRILAGMAGLAMLTAAAAAAQAQVWRADQGDGTYRNPPLYADYPDPDIIRVGEDFYFASTTFVNAPGLTILHSRDLVNWDIVSHVMPRLQGDPRYDLSGGGDYRRGVFAPSLRHHNGRFYVVVTPVGQNTRIYAASDVRGPWTMRELDREAFDPGLFIEKDGRAFIATAAGSDGTVRLLTLNADLSAVTGEQKIHYVEGAEGSKLIRRGDWYYLFNAIPRRLALTVSRARSLTGPWETREQIDDTTGGHQGALVDLPDGGWYGFVMLDAGAIGRVTNISPVFWRDDWPVLGRARGSGPGPRDRCQADPRQALHRTAQLRRLQRATAWPPMAVEPQSGRPSMVPGRAARFPAAEGDDQSRLLDRAEHPAAEGAGAEKSRCRQAGRPGARRRRRLRLWNLRQVLQPDRGHPLFGRTRRPERPCRGKHRGRSRDDS